MIVAIHQPNFFPWLGYFDKIARADVFVLLDDVRFPQTGRGTWCNRVRALVNRSPSWLTMPVERSRPAALIRDMKIHEGADWREKLLTTLRHSYARAGHFRDAYPELTAIIRNRADSLAAYNEAAILRICGLLGIGSGPMVRSSSLRAAGAGTDLLIGIVRAVGGSAYLCGGGAAGYQEDWKFAEAGIELLYQDYHHPVYPQPLCSRFVPGLSIIDCLMNCGFEGAARVVGDGVRRTCGRVPGAVVGEEQ